ncbi:MAG: GNAT family N-acetyltransferase [Promethearchaeota archaeon]
MIETRPIRDADCAAIVNVAEALPEWFDEDARGRAMPIDLRHQQGFVALSGRQVVGFVTLFFAEGRVNIGWLGVHPEHQRKGIGAMLLRCAEEVGLQHGITEISAYTLGSGVDYEPYERTRRFYFSQGFEIYQTSKTDNPGCSEEIKIKKEIAQQTNAPDA